MPQYTTDQATWFEPPDDVDTIRQQEAWEQTDDYESSALDWAINDADMIGEIKDRYAGTADYDRSFIRWVGRGIG